MHVGHGMYTLDTDISDRYSLHMFHTACMHWTQQIHVEQVELTKAQAEIVRIQSESENHAKRVSELMQEASHKENELEAMHQLLHRKTAPIDAHNKQEIVPQANGYKSPLLVVGMGLSCMCLGLLPGMKSSCALNRWDGRECGDTSEEATAAQLEMQRLKSELASCEAKLDELLRSCSEAHTALDARTEELQQANSRAHQSAAAQTALEQTIEDLKTEAHRNLADKNAEMSRLQLEIEAALKTPSKNGDQTGAVENETTASQLELQRVAALLANSESKLDEQRAEVDALRVQLRQVE